MIFHKQKFKKIRENRGLTLKQISIACDVTEATVQRWEKHPTLKPRPAKIPKLAAFLGCDQLDLVQYGDPMEKALDSLNERHEQIQNMLFGADVGDEIDMIERALDSRDRISSSDPDYENELAEENAEIRENGINIPRPAKIGKLAEILKCTKEDLATIDPTETLPSLAKIIAGLERSLSELKRYAAIKEHENDF